jgi:hypothetical protein
VINVIPGLFVVCLSVLVAVVGLMCRPTSLLTSLNNPPLGKEQHLPKSQQLARVQMSQETLHWVGLSRQPVIFMAVCMLPGRTTLPLKNSRCRGKAAPTGV